MSIHVHIERLILDGLPVSAHDVPRLQAAVEAELGRLLSEGGLSENLAAGGAFRSLSAAAIDLGVRPGVASGEPGPLGTRIAGAVYGAIGHPITPET